MTNLNENKLCKLTLADIILMMLLLKPSNPTIVRTLKTVLITDYNYSEAQAIQIVDKLFKDTSDGRLFSKLTIIKTQSLGQLTKEMLESTILQLNDEYSAEITLTEVKVGCQTFPHDKILELAEQIKKLKS
jgi:hypothetical protein